MNTLANMKKRKFYTTYVRDKRGIEQGLDASPFKAKSKKHAKKKVRRAIKNRFYGPDFDYDNPDWWVERVRDE